MRRYWVSVASKSHLWCPYKREGDTETHREEDSEDGLGDWHCATISSQETPWIACQ